MDQGRHRAFADVQAMLADLITTAEDSYQGSTKGTEVGLVAWGQRIALGAANRVGWLAAQQGAPHDSPMLHRMDEVTPPCHFRDLPMRVVVDEVPVDCGVRAGC